MPIAMIASSMRCALDDLVDAIRHYDWPRVNVALRQARALVEELDGHDGAKERTAANDS